MNPRDLTTQGAAVRPPPGLMPVRLVPAGPHAAGPAAFATPAFATPAGARIWARADGRSGDRPADRGESGARWPAGRGAGAAAPPAGPPAGPPLVCLLSAAHPADDLRVVRKEGAALAEAGWRVLHLCPAAAGPAPARIGEVAIETFPRRAGWRGRVLGIPALARRAAATGAAVFHASEPDSWVAAILAARLPGLRNPATRGARVVLDVHEHYPSRLDARLPALLRPLGRAALRLACRLAARAADAVVVAKDGLDADFAVPARTIAVRNYALPVAVTPRRHEPAAVPRGTVVPFRRAAGPGMAVPGRGAEAAPGVGSGTGAGTGPGPGAGPGPGWGEGPGEGPVLVHLGALGVARGWPAMLEALARSPAGTRLRLIGRFTDGSEPAFFERARALGLGGRIERLPWLPHAEALARVAEADIGLVLFQPGIENHRLALPHKLFDCMLAGLPVIVPDFAEEVAAVVRDAACGLVVDPADPGAVAAAVARLADPALRARLGGAGRVAALGRYGWAAEARRLVTLYRLWTLDVAWRPAGAGIGDAEPMGAGGGPGA
ncbi:glycosyltransferase [Roseomonas sp. NAR14]|uniref:Glycosyltransferase n=1 Tax=Roseomonas acroporae TaxID=2937791 RepID=A0A9X1YFX2_9PROT|nr:glycosyltransferase [Roseomonas acroporae]MCK8787952.1 glycosyltransferase [Roseomonas acroporae]